MTPLDIQWMEKAHACARQALWLSNPNPRVGCVLVSVDGHLIAEGYTQAAGQAHAEVMALKQAQEKGACLKGASAYVTLEPCSHHGKTPPCCDALIASGIQRVVIACLDPNPQVNGQGVKKLQEAGLTVVLPVLPEATRALNPGFFSRFEKGRPWVRMKVAASIDGKTALDNGQSQWITSSASRADHHQFRAQACLIMTGIGTLLADDPLLNVREVSTQRQPGVLIVDSDLRCPSHLKVFDIPDRTSHLFYARDPAQHRQALEAKGVVLHHQPGEVRVNLPAVLKEMARLSINEIYVEAGQGLNGAMLQAHLVDELLIYFAPKWIGSGMNMSMMSPIESLCDSVSLRFIETVLLGPDLRVRAEVLYSF